MITSKFSADRIGLSESSDTASASMSSLGACMPSILAIWDALSVAFTMLPDADKSDWPNDMPLASPGFMSCMRSTA